MRSHVEIDHEEYELKDGRRLHTYFVRLYGHHEHNYVSGFVIKKLEGTRGKIRGLAGPGFYDLIGPHIKQIYDTCGVEDLIFEVLSSHLRLVQFKLRRFTTMEQAGTTTSREGREFTIVRMVVKE